MKKLILTSSLLVSLYGNLCAQNWGDIVTNNPTFTSGQLTVGLTSHPTNQHFTVNSTTHFTSSYFANSTSTSSITYGMQSRNYGAGSGIRYGIYTQVYGTGTGIRYGLYSSAAGTNNYAGYFIGRGYFSENVGLGITNPTTRLDIKGEFSVHSLQPNSDMNRYMFFAHNSDSRLGVVPSVNGVYYWDRELSLYNDGKLSKEIDDDTKIAFSVFNTVSGRDVFRIYGTGKVFATEVEVRASISFPDYVFQPNYKLITLEELENYISINSKLPKIPSAEDVKNDGINVGNMQIMQMEKIEELTLYIIELNKKLKLLEEKISQLEK